MKSKDMIERVLGRVGEVIKLDEAISGGCRAEGQKRWDRARKSQPKRAGVSYVKCREVGKGRGAVNWD
jgi:hypothetical protein